MTPAEPDEPEPRRQRPSLDVPPSVLSVLSERLGEAPRISLQEDAAAGPPTPVIDPRAEDRTALPEGRGSYQILGEIARGGMGAVLRGHDTDLGRDVAMKVLHKDLANRPEVVQRFVEEAQIGGQLQHPGIVPVYELGLMADDRPYFTMKLVKGRTLATLIAERDDVAANRRQLIDVFESTCQTVAYAHSRGVIHRDLKPANIMVGAFGEVQVVDWGLAKVLGRTGSADEGRARDPQADDTILATVRSDGSSYGSDSIVGSVIGTPAYMAPEQARGNVDRLDERADVFALGAILCEILTGKPPYAGDKGEVLTQAAQAELDDAYARLDACTADDDIAKLAKRCLVAAPDARPRNAGVVAEAVNAHLAQIERAVSDAKIEAAEARVRADQERKARRLTVLLAATTLGLVGVGAGGWIWWLDRTKREAAALAEREFVVERETRDALNDAELLADRRDWSGAVAALERASALVATGPAPTGLADEVASASASVRESAAAAEERSARARDTKRLLTELEEAQNPLDADPSDGPRGVFEQGFARFEEIFASYGIPFFESSSDEVAALLTARGLGADIALLLDGWAAAREFTRDVKASEYLLEVAASVDPDPVRSGLRSAVVARDLERLLELAEVDLSGQPPETVELLAFSLDRLGQADVALDLLGRAIDMRAHAGSARLHRMLDDRLVPTPLPLVSREERRRGRRAVAHARAAIALEPDDAMNHFFLGVLYIQLGEMDRAIGPFEQSAALSEASDWPQIALAVTRAYRAPEDPDVTRALEEIIASDVTGMKLFWAVDALIEALHAQGRSSDALDVVRVIYDVPAFGSATMEIRYRDAIFASAYRIAAEIGDADEALRIREAAAERGFDNPSLFARMLATADLSRVESESQRRQIRDLAVEYAQVGVERDADSRATWNTLGIALLRLEAYDQALEALQVAEANAPHATDVLNWLSQSICYSEAGDAERASLWFERARPHLNGTVDRIPTTIMRTLAEQAAERLGLPTPTRKGIR